MFHVWNADQSTYYATKPGREFEYRKSDEFSLGSKNQIIHPHVPSLCLILFNLYSNQVLKKSDQKRSHLLIP
jgi:hypothetical protein